MTVDLITIEKFCSETGYSDSAIRGKISSGVWKQGKEYLQQLQINAVAHISR